MDITQFLPWIIFAAFAGGAWALLSFLSNKNSRADERLEELRNPILRGKDKPEEGKPQQSGTGAVGTVMERATGERRPALED